MKNEEIKVMIEEFAANTTDDCEQDLFDQVTNVPDDPNEQLWADNILRASEVLTERKGLEKGIELLGVAYEIYKQIYPSSFFQKNSILRSCFNLQVQASRLRDAHLTMNKYLYNTLGDIQFKIRRIPMRYFSFRGITDYSIDEIKNERIALSHPRDFNDPLDTILVWWLNHEIKIGCKDEKDFAFRLLMKKASEHIKLRCFVGSKYQEQRGWKERTIEDLNVLMWAHYARSHTGLCVEYEFDDSIFKTGLVTNETQATMIIPIEYTKTIDVGDVPNMKQALFQKSDFWEYENEMRLCSFDINNIEEHPYIECPNAIKAIYLGVKCSSEDRRKVEIAIGDKDIPLYQMSVDETNLTRLKKTQIG